MEEIKNKVAESGLVTIDLEKLLTPQEVMGFDIKDFLFMELLLKEKDFRESMASHDWNQYKNKSVAVFCSSDAIIPMWAYMLIVSNLSPVAKSVFQGTVDEMIKINSIEEIRKFNTSEYEGKRVVVKGCGDNPIPSFAYVEISAKLLPVVKSLMYGEPCSTVPVYKRTTLTSNN